MPSNSPPSSSPLRRVLPPQSAAGTVCGDEMSVEIAQLASEEERCGWYIVVRVHVHASCVCACVYVCVCFCPILSPLVVFCMSLSHPKPELLSDDLIDLHESVWGPVKETGSSGETRDGHNHHPLQNKKRDSHTSIQKRKRLFLGDAVWGLMALLMLHTIGTSLHLSHCRIEMDPLIKDPLKLICQGRKRVIFAHRLISISNHVTFSHILLFSIILFFLKKVLQRRHIANW